MMKTVLMVAEKPSLASSLANILSNGRSNPRKSMNSACPVHEWSGTLFGETVIFKMTSVCGHVMTLDFNSKFNNWDKVDPEELFSCPTEKKEASPKLRIPAMLACEARGVDYLVLWLDCDKEGENICFEVIDAVKSSMKRSGEVNRIWRAKFSAITAKDIKAAMERLDFPNRNEAMSVDARQELDLRIGCSFTRFQTKYFQGKYGDLDSSLISYGPCQTPTLGFCVQRHDEIRRFKPEPYWVIQVTIQSKDGQDVILNWEKGRCFERDTSNSLLQALKKHQVATVVSITQQEKSTQRPLALNSVELMRAASTGLGMGPHHAMQLAERLYTQGYISYPRTETSHYSDNFDLLGAMRTLQKSSEWGQEIRLVLNNGLTRPRNGKDCGDHPPITPTMLASRNDLDSDSWKLYDFIVRHFVATISKDCRFYSKTVAFKIGTESFTYNWRTLIDAGFTAITPWKALPKNELAVNFERDEKLNIKDARLTDHMTSPPGYLTESELISMMEKHGIGTDASIPVHINNISQRNYVTVASGRRLVPTNLGIVLVHGYQKIDKQLVEPTMRSTIEDQLNLIAKGEANYDRVLRQTIEAFRQKYLYFVKSIEAMDSLFEVSFTTLAATGKALSRCGKCRRYMKLILAKPSRLHCSHCDETYNLPQNGNIRIYKELKCPLDDFELVTWSTGNKGRSYPLCPYCYNQPAFRDMKKHSGCNLCLHPTCPQGFYVNGIASCLQCDSGVLVLDPSSGPKWKVGCNKCDVIFHLFEDAHKITVEESKECDCGAQLLKIEYKEERTRLPRDLIEMTGCLFCCDEFGYLVEKFRAQASKPVFNSRQGRGKAKHKGKGKPKPPKDKMAQLASYFV